MLEKNSTIVLTKNDLDEYHAGVVSVRIQELWGLSYQALADVVEKGDYVLS